MARLTPEQKEQFIADWKTGHYSQNQLAKNYSVSPATANKICKGVEQTNSEIVNTQTRINTELNAKSECEVNSIHKAVNEATRRANLVYGASEKALNNLVDAMENKKPYEKINVIGGGQELVNVEYGSGDYKNFIDAIDKASVTLGVNQRHATTQINNTNAQQNNTGLEVKVTIDE